MIEDKPEPLHLTQFMLGRGQNEENISALSSFFYSFLFLEMQIQYNLHFF